MNPKIKYINRSIEANFNKSLNKGKVTVLYGARQTGKTTFIKNYFKKYSLPFLYLPCEESRISRQLVPDYLSLKKVIGDNQNLVFDEAQKIDNPGLLFKILIDNNPKLNIIASGSSSFNLANKLNEPLTGRHFQFYLYPFSYKEIADFISSKDLQFMVKETLLFGSYPEIFLQKNDRDKVNLLSLLSSDYLYKDILFFNLVKNSQKINDLLVAISLQLGQEVSYNELGTTIGLDYKTIERYLDLLEKSFIIFRLRSFSRNLRSELNRKVKIYFYDVGVRNSILNNFSSLHLRKDSGALFKNYFIAEKIKTYQQKGRIPNIYFWRTYSQKEIDFIEEIDGKIKAYEIKLSAKKKISDSVKNEFISAYPESVIHLVTPDNFSEYL